MFKKLILILFLSVIPFNIIYAENNNDYVILIHGLGRTSKSLKKIEKFYTEKGFEVYALKYPSTKDKIENLSKDYLAPLIKEKCIDKDKKIHFITHSLGGILTRYYLMNNKLDNLGKVVMLAPPNNGSEMANIFSKTGLFGPALSQLTTDEDSFVNSLNEIYYDVCIITGDRTFNFINSIIIPGKDDGKVSVVNAKLNGVKDFKVVHRSHIFIMRADEVLEYSYSFINKKSQ